MNERSEYGSFKSATIIPFPRPKLPAKRGRPKSARLETDTGTPELVMKRLMGETAETLDLCLERRLITKEQHWCGIHLRWLYTLRHGAPGVRAVDPTHIGGLEIKIDDPQWREAREKEYHEAIAKLAAKGHAPLLLSLCVHNERPRFLQSKYKTARYSHIIEDLRDGLDILIDLWGRKGR